MRASDSPFMRVEAIGWCRTLVRCPGAAIQTSKLIDQARKCKHEKDHDREPVRAIEYKNGPEGNPRAP
jgi:hypothetical protein